MYENFRNIELKQQLYRESFLILNEFKGNNLPSFRPDIIRKPMVF